MIKQHDVEVLRVKEAARAGAASAAWTPVQEDRGHAVRVAATVIIQAVTATYLQMSAAVRLELGVEG